jgi:hypothetical protein
MVENTEPQEQTTGSATEGVGFVQRMLIVSTSFLASIPLSNFIEKRTGSTAATFATLFGGTYLMSKAAMTLWKNLVGRGSSVDRSR